MQSQQTTPSEEWRIRWTPDGSVIERWVDGEHKATGTHADAVAAWLVYWTAQMQRNEPICSPARQTLRSTLKCWLAP